MADTPVVCLLGARQAGKTTLARQFEPTYGYISLADPVTLAFAQSDPSGIVVALPDSVILDEVQRVPELLRAIKLAVDRDRRPGRFLLTGSANLLLLPRLAELFPAHAPSLHPCDAPRLPWPWRLPCPPSSPGTHWLKTPATAVAPRPPSASASAPRSSGP